MIADCYSAPSLVHPIISEIKSFPQGHEQVWGLLVAELVELAKTSLKMCPGIRKTKEPR
jgi:hypothetical protein